MSIADNITRIKTAKADIRSAIIAKGGEVAESATLDTYASAIEALPSGGGGDPLPVYTATSLFRGCTATSINTQMLDTGRVSSLNQLFYQCYSVTELDCHGWNTSKVTNVSYCFDSCRRLTSINVGGWDTSKVTNMQRFCYASDNLVSINLDGWDFGAVTNVTNAFNNCFSLTTITGEVSGINANFYFGNSPLTRESALVLIKGLLASDTEHTLTLKASTYKLLEDDDWDLVPDNWEIAYQ